MSWSSLWLYPPLNLVTQLVKEKKAGFVLFALMAQPSRSQIPMKEVMTNPIKHTNQCFVKICPKPGFIRHSTWWIHFMSYKKISRDAKTPKTQNIWLKLTWPRVSHKWRRLVFSPSPCHHVPPSNAVTHDEGQRPRKQVTTNMTQHQHTTRPSLSLRFNWPLVIVSWCASFSGSPVHSHVHMVRSHEAGPTPMTRPDTRHQPLLTIRPEVSASRWRLVI